MWKRLVIHGYNQPPSGGCVLKLYLSVFLIDKDEPAAFRRLCVETSCCPIHRRRFGPSSLQAAVCWNFGLLARAAGGFPSRLQAAVCWNYNVKTNIEPTQEASRLQAAVCWNSSVAVSSSSARIQPPSGGCVLKLLPKSRKLKRTLQPPSGGCVLKRFRHILFGNWESSCLQAAVCWNRFQTADFRLFFPSRLQAAVCWNFTNFGCQIVYSPQPPLGGCMFKYCLSRLLFFWSFTFWGFSESSRGY